MIIYYSIRLLILMLMHFTVVIARGGASLIYFIYSQPRVRGPPRGHKINLRGHEMINGRGKRKIKKLCYTNL